MTSPLMLSEKDDELLGVARLSDGMGSLAIWSHRARDLVPHLTEQTRELRGFQVLVEAFRLWELYEPSHPQHSGRLVDFFLLVEQAFARVVGSRMGEWPLPGARSVRALASEKPCMSLTNPRWHLLGNQKAGGVWGLYRGAAQRAKLLDDDRMRLSPGTFAAANAHAGIGALAQSRLFDLVSTAMDGETVSLPSHRNDALVRELVETFKTVPLREHFQAALIDGHPLNQALARRLVQLDGVGHRGSLSAAAQELTAHREALDNVIRCEDVLSVVESIFEWLCASHGQTLEAAVAELPVDLAALKLALEKFRDSGHYGAAIARTRHDHFSQLVTASRSALARSVLLLHEKVSEERGRALWVWEDGVLRSDVPYERPADIKLQLGLVWKNDYYLEPLQLIAKQLKNLEQLEVLQ